MKKGYFWSNIDQLRKMSLISIDTLCRGVDAVLYKEYGIDEVETHYLHIKQPTYTYYVAKGLAPYPRPEIEKAIRAYFNIGNNIDLKNGKLDLSECAKIITNRLIAQPDDDTSWGENLWANMDSIESFYDMAGRRFPDIGLEKTYKTKLKSKSSLIPLKSIRRLAEEIGFADAYPILYLKTFSIEIAILVKANILFPIRKFAGDGISSTDVDLFNIIVDNTLTTAAIFEAYDCSSAKPGYEEFKQDMEQIQQVLSKYDTSFLSRILKE